MRRDGMPLFFFFSSRRRHTRFKCDWSSDVCSSDLLVAGNVDVICDQPVATGPHIQAGMLKGYAVATRERLPSLPDVPTFAQAGQPGFELAVWHGLYAPRGTPQAVIERLNKSLRTALSEPALVKRFTDMSVIIPPADRLTPDALRQHTTAEIKRGDRVIKAAGAKAE